MSIDPAGRFAPRESSGASEAVLVERAKADPEAFAWLYELYYSRILNYAYRRTLDVSVAEDLTAETFFKALRGLSRYRGQGSFGAWLYRIATNEVRVYWRARQTRQDHAPRLQEQLRRVHFGQAAGQTLEVAEEKMQRFARLHEFLRALPQRYQTVVVLRYIEGLTYDQIANVLGKRVGTVKSLVHRGLKRLKCLIVAQDATFCRPLHPYR